MHFEGWLEDENWFKRLYNKCMNPFLRFFWYISDYGTNTTRIISWFLIFSLGFAAAYYLAEYFDNPMVTNLSSAQVADRTIEVSGGMLLLRALYFSVVTMTTLGFGDIHAHPESAWGHVLLMLQVALGYVLLGAIITRLGVAFTSEGPRYENFERKKSKPGKKSDPLSGVD